MDTGVMYEFEELIQVTTLGKTYQLLYVYVDMPIMVTSFKVLNSNRVGLSYTDLETRPRSSLSVAQGAS